MAEDLKRAVFYEENARRAALQKQVGGVDAYLASLDMTITFRPFDATGRARIVQLINKSNQYNLTTCRYPDPDVVKAESDPEVFTLQVRLADIFGDNGMISVVICRPSQPGVWEIDTWLMSCRVLGVRLSTWYCVSTRTCSRCRHTQAVRRLQAYRAQPTSHRSLFQTGLHKERRRILWPDPLGIGRRRRRPG